MRNFSVTGAILLIRLLSAAIAVFVWCLPLRAEQGQLDSNPALFSVLAAINAVGYDSGLDAPSTHPIRHAVRRHLAARTIEVLPELRRFFQGHRQPNPTAELSQYISFALSTEGPPAFKYRFMTNMLPPDVVALDGFEQLMARFHAQAGIDELWQKAQPAIEQEVTKYHEPVSRAVLEVNGYLRNPTSGFLGRRFQIYVDLLGAPNQLHTRSYAEDYYVVVTPTAEPRVNDIRRAYLFYMLDPLATKYAEKINRNKSLIDYAEGAPLLAEHYKKDFLLLTTASLVRAVEARLARSARRPAMLEEALAEGFVLAPFFAEQLDGYEKQDRNMRLHYSDMIDALDLKKEVRRLESVQFASERIERRPKAPAPQKPPELTGAAATLESAEQAYTGRQLGEARRNYLAVLQQTDDKQIHAKAYYGLARIAALEKDPELAERLFQKVLDLAPDAATLAWTRVYLGRLCDAAGEREQALAHYRAALAVPDASEGARKAASQGLQVTPKIRP
jgi:tetratricopeptide (TPR) repeat protein